MSNLFDFTSRYGNPDWKAAIWAGIIAGAVFITMEIVLVATIGGDSPWGPPRMIAAILLGRGVLPPPATFDLGIFLMAMATHFALSIALSVAFSFIACRMSLEKAIVAGGMFGIAVYIIDFYGLTLVFPWFAMARNWISILSHAVFGIVLAWTYKSFERPETASA